MLNHNNFNMYYIIKLDQINSINLKLKEAYLSHIINNQLNLYNLNSKDLNTLFKMTRN